MIAVQQTVQVPFSPAINPFVDDIQRETLKWVRQFQLVTDEHLLHQLEMGRFNELTARCYPNSRYEILQIINDWMTWLFILDDLFDEEGIGKDPQHMLDYSNGLIELFRRSAIPPQHHQDPMFISLLDLWQRTQTIAPSDWLQRFTDNMLYYFEACIWESTNRMMKRLPKTRDYIRERRKTGGISVFISWSLLTEDIPLPITAFDHPVFREFFEIVGDVLCWTNDVVSFKKELAQGNGHNLVMLVQRDKKCTVAEAFEITLRLIQERIEDYLHLERLLSDYSDAAEREVYLYIGVLRSLIRGNLDWSYLTSHVCFMQK